jgi:hypothetical protein
VGDLFIKENSLIMTETLKLEENQEQTVSQEVQQESLSSYPRTYTDTKQFSHYTVIPLCVLSDLRLTAEERNLFYLLISLSNGRKDENGQFYCQPTDAYLAELCGYKVTSKRDSRSISGLLASLQKKGFIQKDSVLYRDEGEKIVQNTTMMDGKRMKYVQDTYNFATVRTITLTPLTKLYTETQLQYQNMAEGKNISTQENQVHFLRKKVRVRINNLRRLYNNNVIAKLLQKQDTEDSSVLLEEYPEIKEIIDTILEIKGIRHSKIKDIITSGKQENNICTELKDNMITPGKDINKKDKRPQMGFSELESEEKRPKEYPENVERIYERLLDMRKMYPRARVSLPSKVDTQERVKDLIWSLFEPGKVRVRINPTDFSVCSKELVREAEEIIKRAREDGSIGRVITRAFGSFCSFREDNDEKKGNVGLSQFFAAKGTVGWFSSLYKNIAKPHDNWADHLDDINAQKIINSPEFREISDDLFEMIKHTVSIDKKDRAGARGPRYAEFWFGVRDIIRDMKAKGMIPYIALSNFIAFVQETHDYRREGQWEVGDWKVTGHWYTKFMDEEKRGG